MVLASSHPLPSTPIHSHPLSSSPIHSHHPLPSTPIHSHPLPSSWLPAYFASSRPPRTGRELIAARMRKTIAKENELSHWGGGSGPYIPAEGFVLYFDYVTNVPTRFDKLQARHCHVMTRLTDRFGKLQARTAAAVASLPPPPRHLAASTSSRRVIASAATSLTASGTIWGRATAPAAPALTSSPLPATSQHISAHLSTS